MRTALVLGTLGLAMVVGMIAAASGSRTIMAAVVAGLVPAVWGLSRVIERALGRDMWRFDAPYPYRWMSDDRPTPAPSSPGMDRRETGGDAPRLPMAA